jgi:mono/diheme cytochrome c family protein
LVLTAALSFAAGLFANPPTVIRTANSGAAYVEGEQQAVNDKVLKEVVERLDRIEKLILKALDESPEPPLAPETKQSDGTPDVLRTGLSKCMECHTAKLAPDKGDRFVLFIGAQGNEFRDDFRRSELKMIEEKVRDGTMPKKTSKGKPLTPNEKAAIIAEVSARRAELEKGPS